MYTLSDIDECSENEDICGVGMCNNIENAMFYECVCPDGARLVGDNTDNTLTCNGSGILPSLSVS